MNDVIVLYYSRTGTTQLVAEELARLTGWPVGEVADRTPHIGLWGDLRCLMAVLLRGRAPYRYHGPPLADFSHVVVMAPVWMRRLAAPMRAFLLDQGVRAKRLSVICTMASRGGFRAVEEVASIGGQIPSPVLILRQQAVLSGLSLQLLEDFAAQVNASARYQADRQRPAWLSPETA